MNSKKIFMICSLLFVIFVAWYFYKSINDVQSTSIALDDKSVLANAGNAIVMNSGSSSAAQAIVYQAVQLKSQKDFVLVGQKMFEGTGFEPGFNFVMYLAGTKFGTDLISKNGDTHYVGYLDLTTQSTTTKTFAGKMLDRTDKIVNAAFIIFKKKCTNPKGDTAPLSVTIRVATETLAGCAVMTNLIK